jgi:hypothetical protein
VSAWRVPSIAELSRIGSRRRLRRRWPGASPGLCLVSPARRAPGHTAGGQIKAAHPARKPVLFGAVFLAAIVPLPATGPGAHSQGSGACRGIQLE